MFLPMPMTLNQIVEETRQLPTDVVAELIDRILLARHGGIEPEVQAAWKTEIDRRMAEIQEGKVQGIPVEETLAPPAPPRNHDDARLDCQTIADQQCQLRISPAGEAVIEVR